MSLNLANIRQSTRCEKLQLCLTQTECWDANDLEHGSTANCFRIILALMSCGTILVAIAEVQGRKKQFKEFKKIVQKARTRIEDTFDNLSHSFRAGGGVGMGGKDEYDNDTMAMIDDDRSIKSSASRASSLQQRRASNSLIAAQQNHPDDASSVHGLMGGGGQIDDDAISFESMGGDGAHRELELAFVTTFRTEGNFVKNNTDPTMKLPNSYSAEYAPRGVEQTVLPVSGFFFAETLGFGCNLLISVYLGSIGWAMLCSGFASLLWILVDYEKACYDEPYIQEWIQAVGDSMTLVREDYDFYPVFLLVGYIGYVVERWRLFMRNCHETQAKIHDVALLCGGSILGSPTPKIRKKLYRIYRYLNLIHALTFKSVSPTLGPMDLEIDFVRTLRLLEVDEADELLNMGNKQRDAVIGWLTGEIAELMEMDGVNDVFVADRVARALAETRTLTARHRDLFVRDNPNFYLDLMLLVVNALLFLVVFSYPFSLVVHTNKMFMQMPCFQPIVLIGVFVIMASFRTAYSLLSRLRNPFSWSRDRIKIDSLLASTDRAIFVLLRANFRKIDRAEQAKRDADPRRKWMKRQMMERKAQRERNRRDEMIESGYALDEGGRFLQY